MGEFARSEFEARNSKAIPGVSRHMATSPTKLIYVDDSLPGITRKRVGKGEGASALRFDSADE